MNPHNNNPQSAIQEPKNQEPRTKIQHHMTFTVSATILLEQLQLIQGAIGSNSSLPILEYFLFQLDGNQLKLSATDLETAMATTVEVAATDVGQIAIPAKILLDVLKSLPTQPLTFHIDLGNHTIKIVSSNGKYQIMGESGDDYPSFPDMQDTDQLTLPTLILNDALTQTLFAVSTDELRPAMMGVCLTISEEGATFAATDGFKLVEYKHAAIQQLEKMAVILPKKALSLLTNALVGAEETVVINYNKTNAFFQIGDLLLVCRLIDNVFPNYQAIVPQRNSNLLEVDRKSLLVALKRLSIYANKTTYRVIFNLGQNNKMAMSAQDLDVANEATESIDCAYEGDDLEIAFNAKFLVDILNAFSCESITFKLGTAQQAGILVPKQTIDKEDVFALLIPQAAA